jgi:hypothetical protein
METQEEVRYTPASLEYRNEVRNRIGRKIRDLAYQRASMSGRRLVTDEDMRACVQEAFRIILCELGFDR